MIALPKDLQDAVRQAGDGPVHVTDVETKAEYVVVPAKVYEQLTAGIPRKVLSKEEQIKLLVATGVRAGWNDPELDIYNDVEQLADSIPEGFSDAEQDYLLREAGRRAGWDDPAMDIYDDLDPRRGTTASDAGSAPCQ